MKPLSSTRASICLAALLTVPLAACGVEAPTVESQPVAAAPETTPTIETTIVVNGLSATDDPTGGPESESTTIPPSSLSDPEDATGDAHDGEAVDAAMLAWDRSGYGFEQLEILSRAWNLNLDEAQVKAGLIILSEDLSPFDGIIGAPTPPGTAPDDSVSQLLLDFADTWQRADWSAMADIASPPVVATAQDWYGEGDDPNIAANIEAIVAGCHDGGSGPTCEFVYAPYAPGADGPIGLIFDLTYGSDEDGHLMVTRLDFQGDAG